MPKRGGQDTDIVSAYSPTTMTSEIHLGDKVRLRKKHPCGSYDWEVVRLGVDIGLVCQGCGRRILLPRGTFNKRLKTILSQADRPDAGSEV